MQVKLLSITPDAELLIAQAYGICTGKDTIPISHIQELISLGHLSPIEHASASFLISGISRACSHQLVRHRLASYSQQSMRYAVQDREVVFPDSIVDLDIRGEYGYACDLAFDVYQEMLDNGVPMEDARMVLPIGSVTRLIMTCNLREWRHVIELRCSKNAQWEIRAVCADILRVLYAECPHVFSDLYADFICQQKEKG